MASFSTHRRHNQQLPLGIPLDPQLTVELAELEELLLGELESRSQANDKRQSVHVFRPREARPPDSGRLQRRLARPALLDQPLWRASAARTVLQAVELRVDVAHLELVGVDRPAATLAAQVA